MLQEFQRFLLRGNVVELGVGVVMGVAFKSVVDGFVAGFLTPLIGLFVATDEFEELAFSINGTTFPYGVFVAATLSFAITASVVFFLVMMPMNRLAARYREQETPEPTVHKCPYCLSDIPLSAVRCAYCTSDVAPIAPRPTNAPVPPAG